MKSNRFHFDTPDNILVTLSLRASRVHLLRGFKVGIKDADSPQHSDEGEFSWN